MTDPDLLTVPFIFIPNFATALYIQVFHSRHCEAIKDALGWISVLLLKVS